MDTANLFYDRIPVVFYFRSECYTLLTVEHEVCLYMISCEDGEACGFAVMLPEYYSEIGMWWLPLDDRDSADERKRKWTWHKGSVYDRANRKRRRVTMDACSVSAAKKYRELVRERERLARISGNKNNENII